MRYADAGVNITVADQAKRRIAAMAGKTFRQGVLAPIGGFRRAVSAGSQAVDESDPGLKRGRRRDQIEDRLCHGIHSGVGADILNHCVNDILTQGAEPLFFLDYLAMGKLDTEIMEQVIEGMSRAAKKAGCSLIGGETAEMPDFYPPGEYDLAGFIVGAVEEKSAWTAARAPGRRVDCAALPADCTPTGIRWRASWCSDAKLQPDTYVAEIGNKIGAELLKPHRAVLAAVEKRS